MKRILLSVIFCLSALPTIARADTGPATTQPASTGPLTPGNYSRSLLIGKLTRNYIVHVPKAYDPKKPAPVVLALHGAAMNGAMMVPFCGMNKTSDDNNFIVVYPSGTGAGPFLTWNSGGFRGRMAEGRPDDVAFIGKVLDDLATVANVDAKRVYACGMSNGAMMCYRLAAEMSDRIAAIAPVAGTICIDQSQPKRPVPVLHFHGTKDPLVPFDMPKGRRQSYMRFQSVEDSIQTWVKLDECQEKPAIDVISKANEDMKVTRKTYVGGKDGAEVIEIIIEDGGHTWPGQAAPAFLGKSDINLPADDLIWEFFKKHPIK